MGYELTSQSRRIPLLEPIENWPDGLPAFAHIADMFRAAVVGGGAAPCVSYQGNAWSYDAIDRWSDAVAAAIDRRRGTGLKTERIGLLVGRGPLILAGMIGVLKSSLAFIPIDPAQPAERSRLILEDARPDLIVTDCPDVAMGELGIDASQIVDGRVCAEEQVSRIPSRSSGNIFAPAYVTYTSGSTGRPRGVICSHAGACNLADVQYERFSLNRDARIAAITSIGFDASMAEICMALRAGAVLVIADTEATRSGAALGAFLRNERISHLVVTPTLLAAVSRNEFPDLKVISIGGEAAPQPLVEAWSRRVTVDNAYGPTETSIEVSHWRFSADDPGSRIGRPIRNARFVVRNAVGERADEGELWIGGPMVALGYVGQPKLSAERFVTCSETGLRFYRSGDRVRHVGDGVYDFLGRVDDQVKISGVRIEPEEVRQAIEAISGVVQAAVAAERSDAGMMLVGYYKTSRQGIDRASLMEEMTRRLPPAMIPARLVEVPSVPMRASGKADIAALRRQGQAANVGAPSAAASSAVADAIIGLWRTILNVPDVKLTDNFFQLGGDSLRLTQLIFAINKTYRVKLTPITFRTLDSLMVLIAHVEAALASSSNGVRASHAESKSVSNAAGESKNDRVE